MDPRSFASPARALLLISIAVLLASATWFTGAAVAPQLVEIWDEDPAAAGWLTSATQLGFLFGTFVYALLNLSDRFNARRVFCASAWLGGLANVGFAFASDGLVAACGFRFITGLFLAGVYPVGMRLVASWFPGRLGWQLGVMVGALGLGTATPYLIRAVAPVGGGWQWIAGAASVAAVIGGAMVLALPDGPHLGSGARLDQRMLWAPFRSRAFRLNALGYFGHMWELYALWSLVPFWLGAVLADATPTTIAWLSFATVAAGAIGCVAGGIWSRRVGERRVALAALIASTLCCLASPLVAATPVAVIPFLLFWGVVVVADSPQFSALAARTCPREYTGTALTVQNGIGFAITVAAIQLVANIADTIGWHLVFLLLAPGPALGSMAMTRLRSPTKDPAESDHHSRPGLEW